jgi:hypothetical protein
MLGKRTPSSRPRDQPQIGLKPYTKGEVGLKFDRFLYKPTRLLTTTPGSSMGRTQEAIEWAVKAMRLNPHYPEW